MKQFLIIIIIFFTVLTTSAQQTIRGKITDSETGTSMPGATVSFTGTTITTQTNNQGNFIIHSATPFKTLTVSFVGYENREISITNNTQFLNIEMMISDASLNEITVTAYESNRKLFQTAGSISLLTKKDIQRNNQTDLLPILNTVPGVKMEEEAPGDFKISLRGSALRDPYGVRNMKLYWEDIPLTSPDNSASHPLNIEPSQVGSIEVIKGPSGSIYGAGMGGVILFKNDKPKLNENSLATTTTAGSFGLFRSSTTYQTNTDNFNLSANYTHQTYNGYRQNEGSEKDAVNIFSQFIASPKRTVSFILNHGEGHFGIAGSVDSTWATNTPRKAVQYCIDNKTGVRKYGYALAGISQQYKFNNLFSNSTSVYTDFQTLSHPYGQSIYYNGFLKQSVGGYGGRTKFSFTPQLGSVKAQFIVGDEFQYENQLSNTYDIDSAKTGALQTSNQINVQSNIVFAQAEFDFQKDYFFTIGASLNNLSYNVTDLIPQSATHTNSSGIVNFTTTVSPRIALVKTFNKNVAAHASVSFGFSPPTLFEANNADGSFNKDLKPEHGVNYEVGLRSTSLNEKLNVDISVYQMNLGDAILPFYNQYGGESYRNAGNTEQKGIEATVYYLAIQNSNSGVTLLKPWMSFTYSDYHFKNYTTESFDYSSNATIKTNVSGNKVTGVSPTMLNAGVDLDTKAGFYFNAVVNYISRTPINDLNTYYQDGYTLLASKIGYHIPLNHFGIDVFAGGNNLLNKKYSSWINFNADASSNPPQFFNPSPAINFYGGAILKYNFK
jgi:iron complex outermembrane receptor protein